MEDLNYVFTWIGMAAGGAWAVFIYIRSEIKNKKKAVQPAPAPVVEGAPVGVSSKETDFFRDKAIGLYEGRIASLEKEVEELEQELDVLRGLLYQNKIPIP